jgi:hypothetical protein
MRGGLGLAAAIVFVLSSGAALASDRDSIIESCQTRLKAPARTCGCMADKAIAEFNARELAFFMAIMARGVAGAMTAAPAGMTQAEMMHVAGRVQMMPAECVNG